MPVLELAVLITPYAVRFMPPWALQPILRLDTAVVAEESVATAAAASWTATLVAVGNDEWAEDGLVQSTAHGMNHWSLEQRIC